MPKYKKSKRDQMVDAKTLEAPNVADVEGELEDWNWRHQKRIYNVAYQYLNSPEEADDITQETFLRAYRNRKNFRGDSKIDTWLTRIAINLCLDVLRKRKIRRIIPWPQSNTDHGQEQRAQEFPDPSQDIESKAANLDMRNQVFKAMDKLSPQQRSIFILKHLQDLSIREIVEITGLSEGTIKSQLFRGVHKIRQELKGGGK